MEGAIQFSCEEGHWSHRGNHKVAVGVAQRSPVAGSHRLRVYLVGKGGIEYNGSVVECEGGAPIPDHATTFR